VITRAEFSNPMSHANSQSVDNDKIWRPQVGACKWSLKPWKLEPEVMDRPEASRRLKRKSVLATPITRTCLESAGCPIRQRMAAVSALQLCRQS